MDKDVVVHIYNGILISYKMEWIWVISSELDEARACYTEWNKSEREKKILHQQMYVKFRKTVQMNLFAGQD